MNTPPSQYDGLNYLKVAIMVDQVFAKKHQETEDVI